jgi:hypothetical protein
MEDLYERALRFLVEKHLEQLGIQANITIIKESENEKENVL